MHDLNDLLEIFKKAAYQVNETSQPSDFCFGKVISVSPLKILVEQKMTLGSAQLVLTRNVTDYKTMVTFEWETENTAMTSDSLDLTHNHALKGKKQIIIHNALKLGENVILLKQKGGQKYLILDRVVTA